LGAARRGPTASPSHGYATAAASPPGRSRVVRRYHCDDGDGPLEVAGIMASELGLRLAPVHNTGLGSAESKTGAGAPLDGSPNANIEKIEKRPATLAQPGSGPRSVMLACPAPDQRCRPLRSSTCLGTKVAEPRGATAPPEGARVSLVFWKGGAKREVEANANVEGKAAINTSYTTRGATGQVPRR
jgi:hypothetical protein